MSESPNGSVALSDRASREVRRREMSQITFRQGTQMFQPTSGQELLDMSNLMATAGPMVKDIYRGNPGACMGLIAVCAPYGLNPLQVSWKTYQTQKDGPIAYEAQVIVAMVNASGVLKGALDYEFRGEGATRQCIVRGTLRNGETREIITPTVGQITTKNSPLWKSDPDQQLAYYGGRAWARRHKPEMLLGIYDVDELEPVPAGPENARDVTPAAPRPGRARYVDDTVDDIIDTAPGADAASETVHAEILTPEQQAEEEAAFAEIERERTLQP